MVRYQTSVTDVSKGTMCFVGTMCVVPGWGSGNPTPYIIYTNEGKTSIATKVAEEYTLNAPMTFISEMAKGGYTASNVTVSIQKVDFIYKDSFTSYDPPAFPRTVDTYYVSCTYILEFDCDPPFAEVAGRTPKLFLDPATQTFILNVIKAIGVIVLGALIAYWIVQAMKDALISMTTTTTTTKKWNPETGTWDIITTTSPDYMGILVVAVGGALAIAILYVLIKGVGGIGFRSSYRGSYVGNGGGGQERRQESRNGSAYIR